MALKYLQALFFLCALYGFLFAEPEEEFPALFAEELQTLTSSSDFFVHGLINPLTGCACLRLRDLKAKGAESLEVARTFVSPLVPVHKNREKEAYLHYCNLAKSYRGWVLFPHQRLRLISQFGQKVFRVTLPNGASFDSKYHLGRFFFMNSLGMNNLGTEGPSALNDLRNIRLSLDGDRFEVRLPGGTNLHYKKASLVDYLLEKEMRPNGKTIKFFYEGEELCKVESWDRGEERKYASIEIHGSALEKTFTTHLGQTALYSCQRKKKEGKFKEKKKKVQFCLNSPPFLSSIEKPSHLEEIGYSDQLLLDSFEGKSSFAIDYEGGRAKRLIIEGKILYTFNYEPPVAGMKGGRTTVLCWDGTKKIYSFSKELLLESIAFFDEEGALEAEKLFNWERGLLRSLSWLEGGKPIYKKSWNYDNFGNPIEEEISDGERSLLIKREFSENHLLLREKRENEAAACFSYVPKTNLVACKWREYEGQILLREFFSYDKSFNLIEKIEDDGSSLNREDLAGVTERRITRYILRDEAPHLHLPEWIEESFVEDGKEKPLLKTKLSYDLFGNICKKEVYGSDGLFSYALDSEYDERGNLISETDALGKKTFHSYDDKGRCLFTNTDSLFTERSFDKRGRLIEEKKTGKEGIVHTSHFRYDPFDRLIEEIGPFGNKTAYSYDPLSIKPIEKRGEKFESFSYDSLGRLLSKTDSNGHTTSYIRTIFGKPAEIIYPDGSKETFSYSPSGQLESFIDREGRETLYSLDPLGRPLTKKFAGKDESFSYSGLKLLKKSDWEGFETLYSYDGAGRKITEERAGRKTAYQYDSLGRLSEKIAYNGENSLATIYKRDLLGRVIEERLEDLDGNLLRKEETVYDEEGNKAKSSCGAKTETFLYDSFGRLIEKRDSLDRATVISYDDECLQKKTTDPSGRITLETLDSWGRVLKKERFSSDNTLLSSVENGFDSAGNLLMETHQPGFGRPPQTILYSYNSQNLLSSITRGGSEERKTLFTYTPLGNLSCKTLPDGIELLYSYDLFGNLEKITSSDGSIDYTFKSNALGYQTRASDNQGNTLVREVDPFGNVLIERFPCGLSVEKSYDAFDRPFSLKAADLSIAYRYNPLHLKELARLGSSSEVLYNRHFELFDEEGRLLQESAPDFSTAYSYDAVGQLLSIKSPFFSERYSYSLEGNLEEKKSDGKKQRFSYDALDQLSDEGEFDALYNPTDEEVNELNELLSKNGETLSYDKRGNLIQKGNLHLSYDALNRLTEASTDEKTIRFTYDPWGRLLSRVANGKKQLFLYDGEEEIGSLKAEDLSRFHEARLVGWHQTPSFFELQGRAFACLTDLQGSIRRLIACNQIAASYEYSPFGNIQEYEEPLFNPWRYAAKRLDPDLGLLFFGKRFYDPNLGRWIRTDPAGFIDSINPYQYLLNNPFRYLDPDGCFVIAIPMLIFGAELALPTITAVGTSIAYGVITGAVAYGGYKTVEYLNNQVHEDGFLDFLLSSVDSETERKKPPYSGQELGNDSANPNVGGFKWKGKGEVGSKRGGWHNPETDESLRSDFDHAPPVKPHWDYEDQEGNEARLYLDGTWEWK